MWRDRRESIKSKLVRLGVRSAALALLLACAGFLAYELATFPKSTIEELSALAAVIGSNSTAALAFDDPAVGQDLLDGLREHPKIDGAYLFRTDGSIFAAYRAPDRPAWDPPPHLEGDGHLRDGDVIALYRQIALDSEVLGTILICSNSRSMHLRLVRYAGIAVLVMLVSFCAAWLLSIRLQPAISRPILHLVESMSRVARDQNYEVRVTKLSNDELGDLVDGFNRMLGEIHQRDRQLARHRESLEREVQVRTAALEKRGARTRRSPPHD